MRLGIVQDKADDPRSLSIINQETGEKLENIVEYNINSSVSSGGQFLTIQVFIQDKLDIKAT